MKHIKLPKFKFYTPIPLAYPTAVRMGESLALIWDNIDMDKKIDQSENKLKYGRSYAKTDFVCTHENGKAVSSDDMRYFGQYCKKVLASDKSFHCLRHTHATALLENGICIQTIRSRLFVYYN